MTPNASGEVEPLGDVLRAAWDYKKLIRTRRQETSDMHSSGAEEKGVLVEPEPTNAAGELSSGDAPSEPFVG